MKKVVLILGTFNPVTNAHLNLGKVAKSLVPEGDIYYVPAKDRFIQEWKQYEQDEILNGSLRYKLLSDAIKGMDDFYVSDIEIKEITDGKTIHTVEYFRHTLLYDEVYIICGTDKIEELQSWYRARDLLNAVTFLVISRDNTSLSDVMTPFTKEYEDHFVQLKNPNEFSDVSSTKIRNAVRKGQLDQVRDAIPVCVYEYYQQL